MIIRAKIERRDGVMQTRYYKHTSNGRAICGSKGDAAQFNPEMAKKVLSQLQIMDARFVGAELVDE